MLVVRRCDTGRNTWSPSKLEAFYNYAFSRMSNFDPSSTQPDWQQYSNMSLPEENIIPVSSEPLKFPDESNTSSEDHSGSRTVLQRQTRMESPSEEAQPEPIVEKLQWRPGNSENPEAISSRNLSLVSTESAAKSLAPIRSAPPNSVPAVQVLANEDCAAETEVKDEDEELGDYEGVDAEVELGNGPLTKTAAERRAERRKMKRFRLTHQQTRFLMSEFAKHAHPDAAHRERLSKEIPGLSPRQVQVWFQNRRAKIKRLTADDGERIIKMRAVPDEFDNVQALHSPYGAVHGIRAPMQTPVNFVPTYSDHSMRPLMMESIRSNSEVHMSLTTLSPAFDPLGYNPSTSLSVPDVLSPTINSPDRYYSSHLSSLISTGPGSPNSFNRQSNYQPHPQSGHPPQNLGSLQPSQLRETMSKSKTDTLQSPLRLSMSWKGENFNYAKYQTELQSPQLCGQQPSMDHPEFSSGRRLNPHQYDSNTYPNTSTIGSSPTRIYPSSASTLLEQTDLSSIPQIPPPPSSGFNRNLDFRSQYRGRGPLPLETSQGSSYADIFNTSYVSTPAYMAPPQDFVPNNSGLSSVRPGQSGRNFEIQGSNVEG